MSENGLNMIDLVLTHLDHCWGPPWWFGALKSVLVLDFGHFRHAPKRPISPKMVIFKIFCSTPTFSTISKTKSVQAMQVVSTLKWNNNIGNRNVKYSISDWIVKMSAAWVSCASGNVYFQCINSDLVSQSVAFTGKGDHWLQQVVFSRNNNCLSSSGSSPVISLFPC